MARPSSRMKRVDSTPTSGINDLINAANKNDRFKLLEDSSILPANLTNPVHTLFQQLQSNAQLQQALQLASHFLRHDRLLEFFVPLLHGHELYDLRSRRNYLSDPLARASKSEQAKLLSTVRKALRCLAGRMQINFADLKRRNVHARTIATAAISPLKSSRCQIFQTKVNPKIEIADSFLHFYSDAEGYKYASRSAQYRHDFLFAITLVHEVVHAVGVLLRGNLIEPHYRHDCPETEWGYAWENFMFGSVFNPQDKTRPGTHLLMRKVWSDVKSADLKGGREYCDVSISWIAQWFRSETWNVVAEKGPTAIAPPTTHFKIQLPQKSGSWTVSSNSTDVGRDIAYLSTKWQKHQSSLTFENDLDCCKALYTIRFNKCSTVKLQESNIPMPARVLNPPKLSLLQNLIPSAKSNCSIKQSRLPSKRLLLPMKTPLIAVAHASSPCGARKRRAILDIDDEYQPKGAKHRRSKK